MVVHRKSSQEQNNKRRLQVGLGVTELLNDFSINMFSDELWHDLFVFIHDFVEFVRPSDGAFVCFCNSSRREFYICELDFFNLVHLFFPD